MHVRYREHVTTTKFVVDSSTRNLCPLVADPFCLPAAMLHIRMLSGEEVASIPVEELSDVRSLKRQLSQLKGLPPRFRQRLFGCGSRGSPLDDDMKLDSPTDLELVLLTYSVASPAEADELVTAARDGSITEAAPVVKTFVLHKS